MNISKELSTKIQESIYKCIAEKDANIFHILAKQINVLPLVGDFLHCWGLNIKGEVVCFPFDSPEEIEVIDVNDQRFLGMCRGVYLKASKQFPELLELKPTPGSDAIECSTCSGTGREPLNDVLGYKEQRIGCKCFGLGWLPKWENDKIWSNSTTLKS